MAEPVPHSSQQSTENNEANAENGHAPPLPTNAEDRAAAAALSSLGATTSEISASENDASGAASEKLPSSADQEALGKAMNRLEIIAGAGAGKKDVKKEKEKEKLKEKEKEKEETVKRKAAVKVSAEDVSLLVSCLLKRRFLQSFPSIWQRNNICFNLTQYILFGTCPLYLFL